MFPRCKINALRKNLRQYQSGTLYFYLLLLLCYSILWIIFVHELGIQTSSIAGDVIHTLGDMLVILLPYWFFGRKMRIVPLVCLWLFTFLLLSNVWYFRFWGEVLSPISISMAGNLNEELTDSVSMLWQPGDYIYLIFPVAATTGYFVFRPVGERYSRSFKIVAVVIAAVIFGLGRFFNASGSDTPINREYFNVDTRAFNISKEVLKMKRGAVLYSLHSLKNFHYWLRFEKMLSHDDTSRISNFINSYGAKVEDCFEQNHDKNLVIIVVESLNGSVVGRNVNGVDITPNLNRMISENGSIYSADVVSQIRDGVSSDGQMMIQTGLLPLRKGSASILVGNKHEFPALPGYFPDYRHYAVFASGGHVWREGRTHEHYGYEVYTKHDSEEAHKRLGADGGMFFKGIQLIEADTTQRFLLSMMTASMHVPFEEERASEVAVWSDLPEDLRKYFTVCRYFDEQLGLFVNVLKERGLYDDTVIVVTSDHSQSATSNGEFEPAFFGAFNTGVSYTPSGPVGQVSIFPTILTIMDRLPSTGYRGLAPSMLDSTAVGAAIDGHGVPFGDVTDYMFEAFDISDDIIRGNYFQEVDVE